MSKKIIIVSTVFQSVDIFLGKLINKISVNQKIIILTNDIFYKTRNINLNDNISIKNIGIVRQPNIFTDLNTLLKIIIFFIKTKNFIVLSLTPKASFLTAIGNFFLFRKIKVITFVTGQVWSTKKNIPRLFFKLIDFFIFKNSNLLLTDSLGQIFFLKEEGLKFSNLKLINNGSICGVDTNIFKKDKNNQKIFLKNLSLNKNDIKIIYIGRLNREKGIELLVKIFNKLEIKYRNIKLLIIGSILEDFDLKKINSSNIRLINKRINNPEFYLSNSDIFCLPSYREGFGTSVIEASSCELPVLTSNIYGLNDCMIDEVTGLKFDIFNENDFFLKLERLIIDKSLRNSLGKNGRSFAIKNFNEKDVIQFQLDIIKKYCDE